jgi:1,4-dihydroxy-6-naphthoate synthase
MFYGLAKGIVQIDGYEIGHRMADIQSLNVLAEAGELPVTAISAAHYPQIADKYRIMSCGASVGRNYGPMVVTVREDLDFEGLRGCSIAVPGEFTTSWMLFQIFGPEEFEPMFLDFDEIEDAVRSGAADAGILLHEGQILFEKRGFRSLLDLGRRWFEETELPIPLGLDVVNRSLGDELGQRITDALKMSIAYAHSNEDEALDYALGFGRGIGREDGRKFVRMYVNDDTLDMGDEGVAALEKLFGLAAERGIIAQAPRLDVIRAS